MLNEPPLSDALYAAFAAADAAGEDCDAGLLVARTYAGEPKLVFDGIVASMLPIIRKGLKQEGIRPKDIEDRCSYFKKTASAEWLRIRNASAGGFGRA